MTVSYTSGATIALRKLTSVRRWSSKAASQPWSSSTNQVRSVTDLLLVHSDYRCTNAPVLVVVGSIHPLRSSKQGPCCSWIVAGILNRRLTIEVSKCPLRWESRNASLPKGKHQPTTTTNVRLMFTKITRFSSSIRDCKSYSKITTS